MAMRIFAIRSYGTSTAAKLSVQTIQNAILQFSSFFHTGNRTIAAAPYSANEIRNSLHPGNAFSTATCRITGNEKSLPSTNTRYPTPEITNAAYARSAERSILNPTALNGFSR